MRALLAAWVGEGAVPAHHELGTLYPARVVALHALTREHRRAVDQARRILEQARERGGDWRVGLSCGKDSTALALLLAESGWRPRAMAVKDDLDYPGELAYLRKLEARTGLETDVLTPPSLREFLVREKVSLVEDTHSRAADLSRTHFYGLLDAHRAAQGYDSVLLGLRAEESRGRKLNVGTHGTIYRREYDGLTVAQPLAKWSALDVHAFVQTRGVPLLPMYYCVDPGMDALRLRKSWWIAGGGPARYGHYVWLRRWWPHLWDLATEIDPRVADLG